MSSIKFAFKAHTANTIVKLVLILSLLLYAFHAGHVQGMNHAIQTAQPSVDGEVMLIDFDGQIHKYR